MTASCTGLKLEYKVIASWHKLYFNTHISPPYSYLCRVYFSLPVFIPAAFIPRSCSYSCHVYSSLLFLSLPRLFLVPCSHSCRVYSSPPVLITAVFIPRPLFLSLPLVFLTSLPPGLMPVLSWLLGDAGVTHNSWIRLRFQSCCCCCRGVGLHVDMNSVRR